MKFIQFLFLLIFVASSQSISGQNVSLANQYFEDGEYEKAASIYETLWLKNKNNEYYLTKLTDCYLALGMTEQALKVVNDAINSDSKLFVLRVTKVGLLSKLNQNKEADKELNYIVENMPKNQNIIQRVAYGLDRLGKSEVALQILEKGSELLGDRIIFANDLANMYARTGQRDKMLSVYLDMLAINPDMFDQVTTMVQRTYTNETEYDELLAIVFEKVQDNPSNPQYIELLSWVYIQKKDFKNAFRQMRALDMQTNDQANKIYKLAQTMFNEKQFELAMDAFKYLIERDENSPLLFESGKYYLLSLTESKIINTEISPEQAKIIDSEYKQFLEKYGATGRALQIYSDYADFLGLYVHDLNGAITLLQDVVNKKGNSSKNISPLKIKLADFLIISGDRWEASLLYSQVDKDFKEEPIGQEARYKNALLSYYAGDFEWAQTQFSVLKSATSRLISNDAIDRSVFIIDNMGLDSNETALQMYAKAELLIHQNKLAEGNQLLDSLLQLFPGHALDDDVLYVKAHIYSKQKKYAQAIENYETIMTEFKDEIRCDNAIYELAQLYDYTLNEKEKAMKLYETLFNDFSASVFAVDARQRFRILRGDNIQ